MAKWKEIPDTPSPEAIVRAALERAAETCDVVTMDGIGDIIRGKGDEIVALASDPAAVAAIIKKAGEDRG